MVAISIDNVTKRFASGKGETTAVDSVSLNIPSGGLFFLLGPSGCGKTTLLRMIAGFSVPSYGRILFDQSDISRVPPYQRDTGMVFQSYALWPHMSVSDNVGFGLDARRIKGDERSDRIRDALSLVQMEHLRERRPNQLSGGQQQRVALARAIAIRPKCLLLDEPLSNLDAKLRLEMRSEIRRIVKQSGITTVYVTHDQKEALSMADNIAVMKSGRLEQTGTPAELYRQPATRFVANFIGESNFLRGTVESVNQSSIVVKTPAGPIEAGLPEGQSLAKGSTVSIAFRPEAVAIALNGVAREGVNRLAGKGRASTTYLGEMAEFMVEVPGAEEPIKGFEMNPSGQPAPNGQNVNIEIPAVHIMIVRD